MRQVEPCHSQSIPGGFRVLMMLLALLPAVIQTAALAQISTTAIINGTVADPTGSVIAGAKISITSVATGAVSETVSNTIGSFSLVGLIPGQYDITVSHPGFNTFKATGISL